MLDATPAPASQGDIMEVAIGITCFIAGICVTMLCVKSKIQKFEQLIRQHDATMTALSYKMEPPMIMVDHSVIPEHWDQMARHMMASRTKIDWNLVNWNKELNELRDKNRNRKLPDGEGNTEPAQG
jgi:hypothetical protein